MTLAGFEDVEAIALQRHVKAGEEVWNGYPGQYCTAPKEEGIYTLYQLVHPDTWTHAGFVFEKDG